MTVSLGSTLLDYLLVLDPEEMSLGEAIDGGGRLSGAGRAEAGVEEAAA